MTPFSEKLVVAGAWACGIVLLCAVTCLIGYLVVKGAGSLDMALIFGDVHPVDALLLRRQVFDGLFPALVGTVLLVNISVSLAVPVGIGAGQMSRVDAVRIGAIKAGERARGSVIASDAFFPFADGLQLAHEAGATAAVEPGGSRRDDEVIAAANELGMALVFTGRRHFRH